MESSGAFKSEFRAIEDALARAEHSRRCEGWYRCTCAVGKAEAALAKIKEALR